MASDLNGDITRMSNEKETGGTGSKLQEAQGLNTDKEPDLLATEKESRDNSSRPLTPAAAEEPAHDEEDLEDAVATNSRDKDEVNDLQRLESVKSVNFLPIGPKLILIQLSLMLAVLCVALDNTVGLYTTIEQLKTLNKSEIIAVAIPKITDDFHALDDVGWYASSYLLTTCAFQLFFGKIYTIFNVKWVFMGALVVFELGSLVCAVAPDSTALIVGRAIAGLGSAAIFSGAIITIGTIVELEKRPIFFGMIGGVYGIASVAGPLLGGAFTSNPHLTWRWCFYINLPFGAVTVVGLLIFLRLKETPRITDPWFTVLKSLDPIGTLIFVPAIVCVLLALQYGGVTYPWSSARVIALLVVFGVVIIAFIALQFYLGNNATLPVRIAANRTIAFACLYSICIGGSFFIFIYYLPLWFQAILDVSPVTSGVDSLPFILANVLGVVGAGGLVTKFGYFAPFFIASSILASIGAGLLTTFSVTTSQSAWVGYQFLYGFGVGLGLQQGGIAAQAVLPPKDAPIGTALLIFVQIFGGALFASVAQNLFSTNLIEGILALGIEGFDPQVIVSAGATNLRNVVDPADLPMVLVAYNAAIVKTFQIGLILSCLSIFGAVGIEWKSVKGLKQGGGGGATAAV